MIDAVEVNSGAEPGDFVEEPIESVEFGRIAGPDRQAGDRPESERGGAPESCRAV